MVAKLFRPSAVSQSDIEDAVIVDNDQMPELLSAVQPTISVPPRPGFFSSLGTRFRRMGTMIRKFFAWLWKKVTWPFAQFWSFLKWSGRGTKKAVLASPKAAASFFEAFFKVVTAPFLWVGEMTVKLLGWLWVGIAWLSSKLWSLLQWGGRGVKKGGTYLADSPKLTTFLIVGSILIYVLLKIFESEIVWNIVSIGIPLMVIYALISYKGTRVIGVVAASIVVLLVGINLFETKLPQTNRTLPWLPVAFDSWLSKTTVDSIKIKCNIARDQARAAAAQRMLDSTYAYLDRGDVRLSDSLQAAFYKKWDGVQDVPVAQAPVAPASVGSVSSVRSSMPADSVFTKGTYYIPVDSITSFRIHVVSDKTCNKYSTKSKQTYSLVYDDGAVIHDQPGINTVIPNRPEPIFKLMGKGVVELAVN